MTPLANEILAAIDHRYGQEGGLVWGMATIVPALASRILLVSSSADTGSSWHLALRKAYGEDMSAGAWMRTGDTLAFTPLGTVVDGRLRLQACVDVGKPFRSLVVIGVPQEMRARMDLRASRRKGREPASGQRLPRGLGKTLSLARAMACARLPDASQDPDAAACLAESYEHADGFEGSGGLSRWTVAAFHWLASGRDRHMADSFVDGLVFPEIAGATAPAVLGRNAKAFARLSGSLTLGVLAVAWDSYLTGISFDLDRTIETFPGAGDPLGELAASRAGRPDTASSSARPGSPTPPPSGSRPSGSTMRRRPSAIPATPPWPPSPWRTTCGTACSPGIPARRSSSPGTGRCSTAGGGWPPS